MTASVLKQDPNKQTNKQTKNKQKNKTKKVQKRLFIRTKAQSSNFRGNPLTKLQKTLKLQLNGEKDEKLNHLCVVFPLLCWLCFCPNKQCSCEPFMRSGSKRSNANSHLLAHWSTVMELDSSRSSPAISSGWSSYLLTFSLKQPKCCTAPPDQQRYSSMKWEYQHINILLMGRNARA